MAKKRKANPNRRPASQKDVERAKKKATYDAVGATWAIFFTVMRDKEGYGAKRLQRIWNNAGKLSEEIKEGRITIADLEETIEKEAGIKLL